jgi:fructokinase
MSRSFNIASLGEVLWDVFPEGEKFGGAPANFACHCRLLGATAHIISCVGNDARGAAARDFLDDHGVNTRGLATSDEYETGLVLVSLDAGGQPNYEIRQDVAWDHTPFTPEAASVAAQLDAVCFGSLGQRSEISRATIEQCLAAVPRGCLRVFDINIRQTFCTREVVLTSLQAATVLKLNDEELAVVASMLGVSGEEEDQVRAILEMYELQLVALTKGVDGALMMTPGETSFTMPPKVEVISTVGAGDAFTAAMVTGYLAGKSLEEINRHANAVAARVCTRHGAVPEPEKS